MLITHNSWVIKMILTYLQYIISGDKVNFIYSTPECYTQAGFHFVRVADWLNRECSCLTDLKCWIWKSIKAKHEAGIREDISWSENKDDYLPLRTGTAGKQIWSGFYTTRSNYKGLVKESASILGKVLFDCLHQIILYCFRISIVDVSKSNHFSGSSANVNACCWSFHRGRI